MARCASSTSTSMVDQVAHALGRHSGAGTLQQLAILLHLSDSPTYPVRWLGPAAMLEYGVKKLYRA